MTREKLLGKIIRRIKPTEAERKRVKKLIEKVTKLAEKIVSKHDSRIKIRLVGSAAKDTWLRGIKDIDIFFLFPTDYLEEDLEKEGLAILHEVTRALGTSFELRYAQHPYCITKFGKYVFDLVPCFSAEEATGGLKMLSAVDRTPLHTEFVNGNLKDADEARLLKRFCEGIGVYGADVKHQGFSGYLCELLVIKCGSFLKVMESASGWKRGERLELVRPEKVHKFPEPLVVIDPVDEKRNVASAVSPKNMEKFVHAAKNFLKRPSEKFFFPKKPKALEKLDGKNLYLIIFRKKDVLEDILYSQLRMLANRVTKRLESAEFKVEMYDVHVDKDRCMVLIEVEKSRLPKTRIHLGPPLGAKKEHMDAFRSKYEGAGKTVFQKGGRLAVEVEREFESAEEVLGEEVKNVPKHLRTAVAVVHGKALNWFYRKAGSGVRHFIAAALSEEPPWEW